MASKIIGTGSFVPDNIVDNNYLTTIVDTSDDWIVSRTGIKQRRITKNDEGTVIFATNASKIAIENANIKPKDIDLIIVATTSPDHFVPSVACEVQGLLGAVNATCFDMSAACSGFLFALNTANAYINMGMANTALVIGAETLSKIMNWTDRNTCVLFGDGAGAVILKKSEKGIVDTITGSDGTKKDVLTCKARNIDNIFIKNNKNIEYIQMNGQEVFKFAVRIVPECINQLIQKTNININDIKYFVLHQANERILKAVAKRLNIDIDLFPMNLDKYGNTSGASIPILLDELNKAGKLNENDKIIISGFGGGLTWGATLIEW